MTVELVCSSCSSMNIYINMSMIIRICAGPAAAPTRDMRVHISVSMHIGISLGANSCSSSGMWARNNASAALVDASAAAIAAAAVAATAVAAAAVATAAVVGRDGSAHAKRAVE